MFHKTRSLVFERILLEHLSVIKTEIFGNGEGKQRKEYFWPETRIKNCEA